MTRGDDFWTRRKALVRAETAADKTETRDGTADLPAEGEADETLSDEVILAELGLKDPDEMGPGDDFSAFMRAAVPERLRRRALRRLWGSNPVLACLDGLNDYDDDYTDAAANLDVRTAYTVGRGLVRQVVKAEKTFTEITDANRNAGRGDEAEPAKTAPATDEREPGLPPPEAAGTEDEDAPAAHSEPAPGPRRRIRFTFDE